MNVHEPGPPFLSELNVDYLEADGLYQCTVCQFASPSKGATFTHVDRSHGGSHFYVPCNDGFACKACGETLPNRGSAVRHHKAKHRDVPKEIMYKCPFCPIR